MMHFVSWTKVICLKTYHVSSFPWTEKSTGKATYCAWTPFPSMKNDAFKTWDSLKELHVQSVSRVPNIIIQLSTWYCLEELILSFAKNKKKTAYTIFNIVNEK